MSALNASIAPADDSILLASSVIFPKEERGGEKKLGGQLQNNITVNATRSPLLPLVTRGRNFDASFQRLNRIQAVCGDLCSITNKADFDSLKIDFPDSSFGHRFEFPNVDCNAIMSNTDIDAADRSAPRKAPIKLMSYFTLDGMIGYEKYMRYKNFYLGEEALETVWTKEMVDSDLHSLDAGKLEGSYGAKYTMPLYEQMKQLKLKGKEVLVIGSERPWLEGICLHLGAVQVTTLEYGKITSHHPQIKTMIPSEFQRAYKLGQLQFDVVVSFSSLEHPGLGRYGDALNPWGDILAVARAWCVTKPQGQLFLGLPTGIDKIQWNAHRIFGKTRWPLITANWIQTDSGRQDELAVDLPKQISPGVAFTFRKWTPIDKK